MKKIINRLFGVSALFIILLTYSCSSVKEELLVKDNVVLYLTEKDDVNSVIDSLKGALVNISSFKILVEEMKFKKVYPGRYTFDSTTTNAQMVERLKQGEQDEISIMVGNYSSVYELAHKLAPFFRTDSTSIIKALKGLPEFQNLDPLQMIYCLSPNTYNFHWTNTPEEIVRKLVKPYKKFWTEERKQQLREMNMTEIQAITLASIVQLESYKVDEQARVAQLYHNRLKIGMKLDADPTVIFAKRIQTNEWIKKIKRVYYKDLERDSPYNTYRNKGLPPGPICMPNPSAIKAVLNPEPHDYIFFVADPERPGYHLFAKTLAEQERNAKKYREWADRKGVK